VDTNRLTDGVSSVSPLTGTSPSFPLYNESIQSVDERKLHAQRTDENRKEQGVSRKGAGEHERVMARMELGNMTDVPAPNTTFHVHAAKRWNPSNFAIQIGEEYRVEVVGDQYWLDGSIRCQADGYSAFYDAFSRCYVAAGKCRSYLKQTLRHPTSLWMELVCAVGDFSWRLQEVEHGLDHFLPMHEAEVMATQFGVGLGHSFTASATGELMCFANDGEGLMYNNQGYLNVMVTRVSWPPSVHP